jgi:hypothetical protein
VRVHRRASTIILWLPSPRDKILAGELFVFRTRRTAHAFLHVSFGTLYIGQHPLRPGSAEAVPPNRRCSTSATRCGRLRSGEI